MSAVGAPLAPHYTPPPQAAPAGRPTWTRKEFPQRDCAWRRQGPALTAGSVPLCAGRGWGQRPREELRADSPTSPQAQRFRVGGAPLRAPAGRGSRCEQLCCTRLPESSGWGPRRGSPCFSSSLCEPGGEALPGRARAWPQNILGSEGPLDVKLKI